MLRLSPRSAVLAALAAVAVASSPALPAPYPGTPTREPRSYGPRSPTGAHRTETPAQEPGTEAAASGTQAGEPEVPGPSFEEVLSLRSAGSAVISPDGTAIAYTVRSADWEENGHDTEIWLARRGEEPFPLTRDPDGSSSSPSWSPDGRWLAFHGDRDEGDEGEAESRFYLIDPRGGEARPMVETEHEIDSFEWSPDGRRIAFTVTEPEGEETEKRRERYGDWEVEDAEYRQTFLWMGELAENDPGAEHVYRFEAEPRKLAGDASMTVGSFAWSPDGDRIAFDHRPDPLINSSRDTDVSVVHVDSGTVTPVVEQPMPDRGPVWSPDGQEILFSSAMRDEFYYHGNTELALVPAAGGDIRVISGAFDEDPSSVAWNDAGITFLAFERTFRRLYRLDPDSGEVETLAAAPRILISVDFADDADAVAVTAFDGDHLTEVYRTRLGAWEPERITDMTAQVEGWPLGSREVVTWESEDGASIEGVLFKPEDFDPAQRHPLLVVIHGGPTGISLPQAASGYVYPVLQWLAKGAVVMMPNYRGSAGYGEAFRRLNVRNLGVGDAWDVMSGVRHLVDEGIADPERMGAMGWSQGGYISAFLTTTTDEFQAISVGAGISNWTTYYVNTDIHPFTRQYLKATPWDDPEIYARTSPMTYVTRASTPTLIQHGEFDRRVPIPNAYELYQGLRDMGVETRLVVYQDFGHGIDRPKEQLAATWHNWQWFARHLWDEEVELPLQ